MTRSPAAPTQLAGVPCGKGAGARLLLMSAAALLACTAAHAQSVSLQGMLGSKALLVIDGGAPRAVAPGGALQGVKVLSTSGDQAVVMVAGQRQTLRVGETPVNMGARPVAGGGERITLTADGRGHFFAQGSINNRPVQFLVDTGASVVALGQAEADRLGLGYQRGQRVSIGTANGNAPGWRLKIAALRIGDVTAYDVEAVVTPAPMPAVLLGNSFLNRFSMRRDGDALVLVKR